MIRSLIFFQQWYDDFLEWQNLTEFQNIQSLNYETTEVWIPDIALIKYKPLPCFTMPTCIFILFIVYSSGDMYAFTMARRMRLSGRRDGWISYFPEATVFAWCSLDLTYFPYDVQSCPFIFESWTYGQDLETFTPGKLDTDQFKMNEQWQLYNTSISTYMDCYDDTPDFCYPAVEFRIYLRRKSSYYVLNIIIPCLIIAIVELCVFPLPNADPIKVNVSFSCLLAYTVFQETISSFMPHSSEHLRKSSTFWFRNSQHPPSILALLSIYIDLQMAYIAFAIIGEGVIFYCYENAKHGERIGKQIDVFFRILGRLCLIRELDNEEVEIQFKIVGKMAHDNGTDSSDQEDEFGKINKQVRKKTSGCLAFLQKCRIASKSAFPLGNSYQWLYVASVLDRIVTFAYITFIFLTPVLIFSILPKYFKKQVSTIDWRQKP